MLIHKYDPQWAQHFEDLKEEIDKGLVGLEYQVEHIGSTSVPGLAAKPIIDMDIVFRTPNEFEKIKQGLIKIGYFHNGDQGIEEREVFKRSGTPINNTLDNISHHLYVCPIESKELHRHLLFRNFLRNNDLARLQYQTLKYELADQANENKKLYAELKESRLKEFINAITEKGKTM